MSMLTDLITHYAELEAKADAMADAADRMFGAQLASHVNTPEEQALDDAVAAYLGEENEAEEAGDGCQRRDSAGNRTPTAGGVPVGEGDPSRSAVSEGAGGRADGDRAGSGVDRETEYSTELAIDGLFPYIEDFAERIEKLESQLLKLKKWKRVVKSNLDFLHTDTDSRLLDLEYDRENPTVTDAMQVAFEEVYFSRDTYVTWERRVRAGLDAAMKAGAK